MSTTISMRTSIVAVFSIISSVTADIGAPIAPDGFLGECDFLWDCDEDKQCKAGLLCADRHKAELKAKGLNERTAYCGNNPAQPFWEVCYNPNGGGAFGDPHFQTFDGTQYSFHGQCDLVMARSRIFGNGEGLDIHARTTMVDDWSLISSAAIRIGDDILEIENDSSVFVNGEKSSGFPVVLSGKYTVTMVEDILGTDEEPMVKTVYVVDLDGGNVKVSNWRKMLSIDVNANIPDTEGMMGRKGMDGMVGRDGNVLVDSNEMGLEWQVRDDEPMLFHDIRAPQYPETCLLPKVTGRRLRQSENEVKAAEEACANVEESRRRFCVADILVSGDPKMAHAYRG